MSKIETIHMKITNIIRTTPANNLTVSLLRVTTRYRSYQLIFRQYFLSPATVRTG